MSQWLDNIKIMNKEDKIWILAVIVLLLLVVLIFTGTLHNLVTN